MKITSTEQIDSDNTAMSYMLELACAAGQSAGSETRATTCLAMALTYQYSEMRRLTTDYGFCVEYARQKVLQSLAKKEKSNESI